jgi:hypothetical protein
MEHNKNVRAVEEIQCLGQVLKLAASFKDTPKEKSKNYVLKNSENKKNQGSKKIWVVKDNKVEEKEVEEVKIISNNIKEPLFDLDKYSLNELIKILQSFANDPSFNVHQTGFGSFIANHVVKEKIQCYNNEAMVPANLGDVWIPKTLIVVGKDSHHAILDLGSNINILSKELYDLLDLDKKLENVTLIYYLLVILPRMP